MNRQLNGKIGNLFNGKITKKLALSKVEGFRHSTYVENILHIRLFLTNKPNSPIVHLGLTSLITMIYTILASLTKVKFKPIQTQFKPKQTQLLQRPKMNANIYYTIGYNNETALRLGKNKPNSNPIFRSSL